MKIIEICDRGIRIIEDKEIINQALFQEYEDIPYEIKELLSIYEEREEIKLDIKLELPDEIVREINNILKENGWRFQENKELDRRYIFGTLIFTGIGLIYYLIIAIFNTGYQNEIESREKREGELKKRVITLNQQIDGYNKNEDEENNANDEIISKESDLHRYLEFFSMLSQKSDVEINQIEFQKERVLIKGEAREYKDIFKIKQFISDNIHIKGSKFDYIKREGKRVVFLLELENRKRD